jgi:hypothetical protein
MGSDTRARTWLSRLCTFLRSRYAVVVVLLLLIASYGAYLAVHRVTSSSVPDRGFSWLNYIQLNPDLRAVTYEYAIRNYAAFGKKRGRPYLEVGPEAVSVLHDKLNQFANGLCKKHSQYDADNGALVIYHVPRYDANVAKVTMLNLALFVSTIHSEPCQTNQAFFVFSVNDDASEYTKLIPRDLPHVSVLHWPEDPELDEYYQQLRTLEEIGAEQVSRFGAVILLSINTRGPLNGRTNNQWIGTYRALLNSHRVGIVSPVGCQEIPLHVPLLHQYAVGYSAAYVKELLREFAVVKYKASSRTGTYESEMNRLIGNRANSLSDKLGYRFASIVQQAISGATHYEASCRPINTGIKPPEQGSVALNVDPRWCDLDLAQQVFVLWGSDHVRMDEYLCSNNQQQMRRYMSEFGQKYPEHSKWIEDNVGPVDGFEMRYNVMFRELLVQYVEEERREHTALTDARNRGSATAASRPQLTSGGGAGGGDKVCFLVRTASMHDAAPASPLVSQRVLHGSPAASNLERYSEVNVQGLIRSKSHACVLRIAH